MAASMPVSRPRRKSGAVTSCPKDTAGAELHKRHARLGRNRAQREDALVVDLDGLERPMTQKTDCHSDHA